jgi:hypothetical protein
MIPLFVTNCQFIQVFLALHMRTIKMNTNIYYAKLLSDLSALVVSKEIEYSKLTDKLIN